MRAEVLNEVNKGRDITVIVSFPEALAEKVVTRRQLSKNTFDLKIGDTFDMEFIDEAFQEFGFEKVDYVFEPGQYSMRGGIVDVFSFSFDHPYRIEFFGDEVESIRKFDPVNQLSVNPMTKATIVLNVGEKLLQESRETILEFLPGNTVVWTVDTKGCAAHLDKEVERARGHPKSSPVKPATCLLRSSTPPPRIGTAMQDFRVVVAATRPLWRANALPSTRNPSRPLPRIRPAGHQPQHQRRRGLHQRDRLQPAQTN